MRLDIMFTTFLNVLNKEALMWVQKLNFQSNENDTLASYTWNMAPCNGIRIPEWRKNLVWNPKSLALESWIQLKESESH